jgi:molecular chaperone GrpE (heat shock protein)
MFMMPNPDLEPNTIAQLLKPGFMLKERVLRAAQVGVCQAP